jgi:hypothetical protein
MTDLKNTERPILFGLPYEINYQDQKTILDYAYANSNSWSGQVQVWEDDNNRYDQTDYFGRVQITRLTQDSIDLVAKDKGFNSNWLNWACRLHPNLEWEWIDTPITDLIKSYVKQIEHLYIKFNRVLILVQKPGSEIPLHTDKAVRNCYNSENFVPGPATDIIFQDNNYHWDYNKYLTLKFPLTDKTLDNGKPIVKVDNVEYQYTSNNKLFAINEVDILHGAKAVDHRRGVIFLDGLLNYEALKKESWNDIGLQHGIY